MTTVEATRGVPTVPKLSTPKSTLLPLTALVVGSMVGGGVFNLPSDMSKAASPGAVLVGWLVSGIGMLMLAFVYQGLATSASRNSMPAHTPMRRLASVRLWASTVPGDTGQCVSRQRGLRGRDILGLSYFFPFFGDGNNLFSIIGASICLWLIHALVLNGIKQAAFVNVITTIAKLVPIFLFVVVAIIAFNWDKFTLDFWGQGDAQGQAAWAPSLTKSAAPCW